MLIIQLLVAFVLVVGVYSLTTTALKLPTNAAKRNLSPPVKGGVQQKMNAAFIRPLAEKVARLIKMPSYKRTRLAAELERAQIPMEPEQYYADAFISALYVAAIGVLLLIIGMAIPAFACVALAPITYFRKTKKVTDALKKKNDKILFTLPSFVLTVNEALKSTRDIKKIIEKYLRDVPNTPLDTDLKKLLARIESNENIVEALQAFDSTLNVPELSNFVTGLIEVTKGVDQSDYFRFAVQDMQKLSQEMFRRKAAKRPAKVKLATAAMLICFLLLYLTPVLLQLAEGFALFN